MENENNTIYVPRGKVLGTAGRGKLIILEGSSFSEIDLNSFGESRLFLGRDPGRNHIVLHSPIVSAVHGKIKIENGNFFFADMNSTNGIFMNHDNRFEKLQTMQYYPLIGDKIFRIDAQEGNNQFSVVLFFSMQTSLGEWKQIEFHKPEMTIGRSEENDIVLGHVGVSRRHAILQQSANHMIISDNHSMNGIFVNGIQVIGSCKVFDRDIIQIANSTLFVVGNTLVYKSVAEGINLEIQDLTKVVDNNKTILDHVSCRIENNEFVAIIGGSGAGKTTLMTAMSGFDTKVSGTVLCNGINLKENFDSLKNVIGFVPQQDIIYENLTLKKMLYYTARMKMPEDTTNEEIMQRIDKVLAMVELTRFKDHFIKTLSGGQKKRASIAVELLADPGLFFLDEPTSGLDPGTEQKLMQTLSRLSKKEEKTIIMVTHTTQSLHLCDKIIIMGSGGRLCFCGTPEQAKEFFQTQDLVDIYNYVTDDSKIWAEKYRQAIGNTQQSKDRVTGKKISIRKSSPIRQLSVLIMRYAELIWNDKQRLLLLLIQPLIIALLLHAVAGKRTFKEYEQTKSILFALACAGIWIGMFNTIQEICKERVILKREYMGNLRLGIYILSKYVVQSFICFTQAAILTIVFLGLSKRKLKAGLFFDYAGLEIFFTVFITILASASIGLVISALVKNADRAMAIAPFILIVQLLFSGILFDLKGPSEKFSLLTVSRWSVEGLGSIADLNTLDLRIQIEKKELKSEFKHKKEDKKFFWHSKKHLCKVWGIKLVMAVICAVISAFVLRKLKEEQR